MKKKNREALWTALADFQNEYRVYMEQVRILMERERCGICDEGLERRRDPSAGQDWEFKLDILVETVERVLEDER